MEIWIRIEAGQLDRAAVLVAELMEHAEHHGLDMWRLGGATQQASIGALAALGDDGVDPAKLANHIAAVTTLLDTLRMAGINFCLTFYDAVLARVMIAAGQPELARERLGTALALAADTRMQFYDAELLRLRANTQTDPDARRAIAAALDLARRQDAPLFELRAALDDFDLRGEPARAALADVVERMPADSAWPELEQARASLSKQSPRI